MKHCDQLNPVTLAYLGDAVYELYIRKYLLSKKIVKVNELQKESLKFVSAKSQAVILKRLIDNNILTKDELNIIKKGRNTKSHKPPKNTDIITYKYATGLESLIGYLFLTDILRVEEIMKEITGEK